MGMTFPRPPPHHRHRPSGVRVLLWLVVVIKHHRKRRQLMGQPATVVAGHEVIATYVVTDQNGQPMVTQPPLDAPASWTDTLSVPGVDTNAVSADGTQDVIQAVAPGTDTVGVSVTIGGKTFTDSALLTVSPAPQVASGVQVVLTAQ